MIYWIKFTFKSSLVRLTSSSVEPSNPSVSRQMVEVEGSYAAHIPTVQEVWSADIGNTSEPANIK